MVLAHRIAFESDRVTAEMVMAREFMEITSQYEVSAVPQTTINAGAGTVVGTVPEPDLIQELQKALG